MWSGNEYYYSLHYLLEKTGDGDYDPYRPPRTPEPLLEDFMCLSKQIPKIDPSTGAYETEDNDTVTESDVSESSEMLKDYSAISTNCSSAKTLSTSVTLLNLGDEFDMDQSLHHGFVKFADDMEKRFHIRIDLNHKDIPVEKLRHIFGGDKFIKSFEAKHERTLSEYEGIGEPTKIFSQIKEYVFQKPEWLSEEVMRLQKSHK